MAEHDLNQVHRRYISLSNTFKSAWTFHQFLQGLKKVFSEIGANGYSADFQSVYTRLKKASDNLNESTVAEAVGELQAVETQLATAIAALHTADRAVSPGLLRQFFQRVKNFDDNILSQLLKFYLYSRGGSWEDDQLDKADYVLTKLCEEYRDDQQRYVVREATHLREVAQGLWSALGVPEVAAVEVATARERVAEVQQALAAASSIDELYQAGLVERYRDLKHELGDLLFQPEILPGVVATNLMLKNAVQDLYRREEERIVAEYQQIFELERDAPMDGDLSEELTEFRRAVESFEGRLQKQGLRLDELGRLRDKVRKLLPRLQSAALDDEADPVVPPRELREAAPGTLDSGEESVLDPQVERLVERLDNISGTMEAKKVALQPEVYALGVQAREVRAYRRLYGGEPCDRARESLVLRAAALRIRIEEEVEEIRGLLDESAHTRSAPVFDRARVTNRLGDLFLRRFDHEIDQALGSGDAEEALALRYLKMRLMRSHSGLWLIVN